MAVGLMDGPRLKIKRAYRHIKELEAEIERFINSGGHRIVIEKDTATGDTKISLQSGQKTAPEINLVFGDVVHNLRAALDHAMGRVVQELVGGSGDHIYFPIRADEHGVKGALRNAEVGKAMATPIGQSIARKIITDIKPYGTLDNPFRAVNKLDNIDKHRALITTPVLAGMIFTGEAGGARFVKSIFRAEVGSKGGLIRAPGDVQGEMDPSVLVVIGEPNFPPLQPLLPTLNNMAQAIVQAIETVDGCFP